MRTTFIVRLTVSGTALLLESSVSQVHLHVRTLLKHQTFVRRLLQSLEPTVSKPREGFPTTTGQADVRSLSTLVVEEIETTLSMEMSVPSFVKPRESRIFILQIP